MRNSSDVDESFRPVEVLHMRADAADVDVRLELLNKVERAYQQWPLREWNCDSYSNQKKLVALAASHHYLPCSSSMAQTVGLCPDGMESTRSQTCTARARARHIKPAFKAMQQHSIWDRCKL